MKKLIVLVIFILAGCSNTSLVENWKNPDIASFNANKVLVVGMTQNRDVRVDFETQMKKEFNKKSVDAVRSSDVFDISFTDSKKSEKQLDSVEHQLLEKNFDAILFTKIIGSEDQRSFLKSISELGNNNGRFNDDYLVHQGIYYDPDYYDIYTVFHAETSLYCICKDKKRSLIWRGGIDITDPANIEKTIGEYVKLVILALQKQDLIFTKQ